MARRFAWITIGSGAAMMTALAVLMWHRRHKHPDSFWVVVVAPIIAIVGQVFALFVLTVAAGEAAIGLAIVVVFFRNRGSIAVEDVNLMKG